MRETRTERDLAEALTELERYAPDPDLVRAAVQHGLRPGQGRRLGRPASPGWLGRLSWLAPGPSRSRLGLSITVAVVAAVLAVALLPGSGSPAGRNARPGLPSAASVVKSMLTAYESVSGDVEYTTQTGIEHGVTTDVYRNWSWPAQPAPGQRQLDRTMFSQTSPGHHPVLRLNEDLQLDFVTPRGDGETHGQVTMVCYLGTGQTGCGWGDANTLPGTWSRYTTLVWGGSDVGAGAMFNPANLAGGIADGAWRVVGRTSVDGQQAIKLSETGRGRDIIEPLPVLLWVNAQSYLPIRLVQGSSNANGGSAVQEFSFLPATAANLALLQVPIPAGYRRAAPER